MGIKIGDNNNIKNSNIVDGDGNQIENNKPNKFPAWKIVGGIIGALAGLAGIATLVLSLLDII